MTKVRIIIIIIIIIGNTYIHKYMHTHTLSPVALLHSDAKPNMQHTSMNSLVGLNCLSMPYSLAVTKSGEGEGEQKRVGWG